MEGRAVRIDREGDGFQRVPLRLLELVVVHGAIDLRADVVTALADQGVPMVLFPGRGRGAAAFCGAGLSAFGHWRELQYQVFLDPEKRLEMTRALLRRKLVAYLAEAETSPLATDDVRARLGQALDRVAVTGSVDGLRGVEGAAQAAWFGWLRTVIPDHWGFAGRARRPPPDPVNALLSLIYTLLQAVVAREVESQGLDPSNGFLHVPSPNRPALSLDVMESLRARVDIWVLGLLADFEPTDFRCSVAEGCRLHKEARGRFYGRWQTFSASGWPVPATLAAEEGSGDVNDDISVDPPRSLRRCAREQVTALRHDLRRMGERP